jgi:hypothetical protein
MTVPMGSRIRDTNETARQVPPLRGDALEPAVPMPLRPNAPFNGLFEPPWYENEIRGERKLRWAVALPFVLLLSAAFWWGILKLAVLAVS